MREISHLYLHAKSASALLHHCRSPAAVKHHRLRQSEADQKGHRHGRAQCLDGDSAGSVSSPFNAISEQQVRCTQLMCEAVDNA